MPAGPTQRNQRDAPQAQASASSTTKTTHIRNKDGTKLIAVPARKTSTSESAAPPPPPPATSPMDNNANGAHAQNASGKKKKKKKGSKQNAAQSAQSPSQHHSADGTDDLVYDQDYAPPPLPHDAHEYQQDIRSSMAEFGDGEVPPDSLGDEGDYESDQDHYEDDEAYSQASHNAQPAQVHPTTSGKKNKKKKKKKGGNGGGSEQSGGGGGQVQSSKKGKDRIWNTSTAEERERIKDFWLSLGEEERRSLVKVEKEAVLRKMKEQQKHSCSCSVCGRKRTAIEEELEVLYDAYYEELEQYANQQQTNKYLGHIPPPHAAYANAIPPPPPPPTGPPPIHRGHHNHHVEELDDEEYEDDDEEYDDEDDDDEDDVLDGPLVQNDTRPDFFNFGNSLTVQGATAQSNSDVIFGVVQWLTTDVQAVS